MTDPYEPMFGWPITDWYRSFAWRPVETVDRGWRWLRPVYRRRIQKKAHLHGGGDFWFQSVVQRPNSAVQALGAIGDV